MSSFHVYCVANDGKILARDLQSSPDIANQVVPLSVLWNETSASAAYARALTTSEADLLIFAHQDLYLPRGWFNRLARVIDRLDRLDQNWAVIGLAGRTHSGAFVANVWDSGVGCVAGAPFADPVRAASLDELVLIVRRAASVGFDPQLPCFHLYGTDLVLSAEAKGKTAYIINLPAIHNSKPVRRLGRDYIAAYRFMVGKWRDQLPWPTVPLPLTANRFLFAARRLRLRCKASLRASTDFPPLLDPAAKARELNYE